MSVHPVRYRADPSESTTSELTLADGRRPCNRLTITRVGVSSVVKLATLFWSILGAVILGTLLVVWTIMSATGAVNNFERFVTDLTGVQHFHIMSGAVLSAIAIAILLLTVLCIALSAIVAMWFNTLAALVGGIEVDYDEQFAAPGARGKSKA